MMRALFIVSRQLEDDTAFRLAEGMVEEGCPVSFLFIGGGCRHAADRGLEGALRFAEGIHVLREDCRDMGLLGSLAEGVEAVDYEGWVDLLEACEKVVSWN